MKSNELYQSPVCSDANLTDFLSEALGNNTTTVFLSILRNQDAALVIRNKDFQPLYANPAFFRLFGTTYQSWKKDNWSNHFSPNSTYIILNEAIPQTVSGKKWRGKYEIQTLEGKTKLVEAEWDCICDESGEIICFYGLYNEVSTIRYFESELRRQNDFLNEIIDTLPDPLSVKNEKHIWLAVNRAFCRLTGYSREEMLGKTEFDFFPKEEAVIIWEQDDKAMSTDREIASEEYLTQKNGEKCLISRKRVAITRSDGEKLLISIGREITKDRRLEKTFADSYVQLESGLNALKHELTRLKGGIESGVARSEAIRGLLEQCNNDFTKYIKEKGLKAVPKKNTVNQQISLSPREYQVLMLLVKGLRIKDIAKHLGVSANTASTYRSRTMKKLELTSMTEIIQYAIQNGLI
jgi:PAS domain S-box-containing protein